MPTICSQFILQKQLESHERALAPIATAFRQIDQESSGCLDQDSFVDFCKVINPTIGGKEIAVLSAAMDPHKTGRVTFSSCAHTLASELTRIAASYT